MRVFFRRFGITTCLVLASVSLQATSVQDPAPDIPSLLQAGQASFLRGDYEAARQSFVKALDMAQETPAEDPTRYDILKRLVSARAAAGEFADADNYLQMAINWRETALGPNDPKIVEDLLISVRLCRGLKDFDRALRTLARVMGMHRAASGLDSLPLADDSSRIAQIYMDQKNVPSAVGSLQTALVIRGKIAGPMDPSLVPDLDRLAAAHIIMRAYDKAEETYRRALVIRETLYGKEDPDLISTVDGMAYAMFGQKKYEEAEPVYRRLIALWIKSVGTDHPMVAMTFDKVAMFYADQKKYDQAKEAQVRANAIRTHFLATGLNTEATEQIAEGNNDSALVLYHRAMTVMDPPNPIYEGLRSSIAEVLKSAEPQPRPIRKTSPSRKE